MNFLASIPIWVYFVVLAVTFMVVHLMALRADQPQNRMRSVAGRVGSSLLLLIALFLIDRNAPASVLLSLLIAAVAGFVSGRTATPALPPRSEPEAVTEPGEPEDR